MVFPAAYEKEVINKAVAQATSPTDSEFVQNEDRAKVNHDDVEIKRKNAKRFFSKIKHLDNIDARKLTYVDIELKYED